jgi:thiosulfate dehydrogenase [quinone] large subunit
MFMNLLRKNRIAAVLLAILRVYIGYRWLTAGYSKIMGGSFEAGGFIQAASENAAVPGWWSGFLQTVALPNQEIFSFLVMWGEFLVGMALILGIFTNFAALMGITMNLSFLFSGAGMIDAQMAILTVFIAVAGSNAGRYGLDKWVIPFLKTKTFNKKLSPQHEENAWING